MIQFTTAAKVGSHLKLSTADQLCTDAATAVNAILQDRPELLTETTDEAGTITQVPAPSAELGATMLGARLHRRRNTPNGLEAIDGTVASYVARTDPDVARLLLIDSFAPPAVG